MTGMMKPVLIAAVLIAVVVPRGGEARVDCDRVVAQMFLCIPYMVREGPIGHCCDGVKSFQRSISSTEDRRYACTCLMKSLRSLRPDIEFERMAELPKECSFEAPYMALTPTTDCSKLE